MPANAFGSDWLIYDEQPATAQATKDAHSYTNMAGDQGKKTHLLQPSSDLGALCV